MYMLPDQKHDPDTKLHENTWARLKCGGTRIILSGPKPGEKIGDWGRREVKKDQGWLSRGRVMVKIVP